MDNMMALVAVLFLGLIISPLEAQLTANVSITSVVNATAKGAVCLDGSPTAYYFDKGQGEGVDNWLIFLQGGGWCANQTECKKRTTYGGSSSKYMLKNMSFASFLSKYSTENSGNVEAVDTVNNLTYRGARIFKATMDDLLAKRMKYAKNALLSGSSAGGLTTIIHCDHFRKLLPITARVKCLAIASYFVHEENLIGSKQFESTFEALITLHLRFNLFPEDEVCLLSQNCTYEQKKALQDLRWDVLLALPKAHPLLRGMWITSCIAHNLPYDWNPTKKMKIIGDKTYPEVFNDWYFDLDYIQVIEIAEEPRNCTSYGIYSQPLKN